MNRLNYLKHYAAMLCLLCAVAPHLEARNKKGDKIFKQAQKAEADRDWDLAMKLYDEALATDSGDAGYLLADQRMHSKAAQQYIAEGRELQRVQKLDNALVQFQRAFLADPGSQVALQEIRSTTAMLKKQKQVAAGTPVYTPAEQARQDSERRINSLEGPPTLRPITNQIHSLKMNNQPARMLYESVCKLAGINALFDPGGLDAGIAAGKNFNLDLSDVSLEEALNYVALTTHTFWKPISRNAIFVTQEGEQKRQEYQDEVVKVFYVQNASTQNEFTEIFNGVRTGAKLSSNVFQVASQNAIIARGTPDTIAIVEKLIHDLDKPKPEVMLDVIVMEVNKMKASTIGAALLGAGGLSVPLNYTPRNGSVINNTGTDTSNTGTSTGGTSTSSQVTLAQLGHLSSADFSTSLPSTIVQALMSDTTTHILQRPQIRATDGGKASLKIGLKVPYVSGSLNSAVATPGAIPYATTQFQQIETGTLIDLEPHVNGLSDISMHIRVELSNVANTVNIAGVAEPEIAQQIDEAVIRMKDGEVSILGGLSDKEHTNAFSGLPGFTNIPILSYLFGTKIRSSQDQEVLITIIPHIIRAPENITADGTGVFAGTERVPRVQRGAETMPASQPEHSQPAGAAPSNPLPRPNGAAPLPQYPPRTPAPVTPTVAPGNPNVIRPATPNQSNPQ